MEIIHTITSSRTGHRAGVQGSRGGHMGQGDKLCEYIIPVQVKNLKGQEMLKNLTLLNIESQTFINMNFDDVIKNFAV